ncbi:MAG: DUF2059 domain-containing protein [Cytophagales bacterium]|nr:DUF2059 domain-containing protein [Cytophagales bacterium]
MKHFLLVVILWVAAPGYPFAQDKAADIRELFKLMQTEKMIGNTTGHMAEAMRQQVKGKINDEAKFDEYMNFVVEESRAVSKKMVYTDLVRIYGHQFTHQEIKEYLNFYKTPAGQKMVTLMPSIQNELMQRLSQNHMPALQAKFKVKLA